MRIFPCGYRFFLLIATICFMIADFYQQQNCYSNGKRLIHCSNSNGGIGLKREYLKILPLFNPVILDIHCKGNTDHISLDFYYRQ